MKGFYWSRRTPPRCTLDALSDHQLKDIGLSRFEIAFAIATGIDSQASVHPSCDSPEQPATRGRGMRLAALGAAIALALILLTVFAATVHFAGGPIVDMRL